MAFERDDYLQDQMHLRQQSLPGNIVPEFGEQADVCFIWTTEKVRADTSGGRRSMKQSPSMAGPRDARRDNKQWALRIKILLLLGLEGKSCEAFAP